MLRKLRAQLLFCLLSSCISQGQDMGSLKFQDSFETTKMKKRWYYEVTKNNRYFLSTENGSSTPKGRFNDGFLITEMNSTGVSGVAKRTEMVTRLFDSIGAQKYLSFSIKIPNSFKYEEKNLGRETMVCQWHSRPEEGQNWDYYRKHNKFNRPSIAVYLTTNDNEKFYLLLRYGNNGKPETNEFGNIWSTVALKRIEPDQWYDLVFNVKWSINNDGYIAAWINNEPFTPYNGLHNEIYGANMHNRAPVTFKMGQYRYFDDANTHQVFYDEVRIGDSFEEVSLYSELPEMFNSAGQLRFVKNHK